MILEKFTAGPLSTNCYIFGDGEVGEVVVIDPDVGAWERIRQALGNSMPVIKAILATHGHFDHVGAEI